MFQTILAPCRSGRRRGGFALLLALLAGAAACRGEPPLDSVPVSVDVRVAPTPPLVGPALIVVEVRHEDGAPVEDAGIRVEGHMAHPGMTPVIREAEATAPGVHRIPDFEFTMGGEWLLRVHVELPDGRSAVRDSPVHVVSGPPVPDAP